MNHPVRTDALPEGEADAAREFWAAKGINKSYTQDQHWRHFMAARVLAHKPARVLEFGCNAGRNLYAIREQDPTVRLRGVDLNPDAVAYGRKAWKLDLVVGDDRWLERQPDDAFDVIFTVSVIDHLAEPDPVLAQMQRVAPTLLLLEPWLGREGKVSTAVIRKTSPYSYSWDLARRFPDAPVEPYRLTAWGLGPFYRLHTITR